MVLLYHLRQLGVVARGLPRTLEGVAVQGDGVAEVEHIANLSFLEQGGVALSRDLLNLPLHGRQQHLILARVGVGGDHHAVDGGVHLGLIGVLAVVLVGLLV